MVELECINMVKVIIVFSSGLSVWIEHIWGADASGCREMVMKNGNCISLHCWKQVGKVFSWLKTGMWWVGINWTSGKIQTWHATSIHLFWRTPSTLDIWDGSWLSWVQSKTPFLGVYFVLPCRQRGTKNESCNYCINGKEMKRKRDSWCQ